MSEALSLSSQMLRMQRRGRGQKGTPRVRSQAPKGPVQATQAPSSQSEPESSSYAGPAPIPPQVSGFPASACPGLLTRAAVPNPPGTRGGGGWGLGAIHPCPSPSSPGVIEARSPPIVCGPGCLSPLHPPPRLGPAGFLTSPLALLRWVWGLQDGAPAWEEEGEQTGRGSPEPRPHRCRHPYPHPAEVCCQCILKRGQK